MNTLHQESNHVMLVLLIDSNFGNACRLSMQTVATDLLSPNFTDKFFHG